MYKANEFGRNELEEILKILLKRTQKKKQYWMLQNYRPIMFEQEKRQRYHTTCISQKMEVETRFRGLNLQLSLAEKIYIPNEKGDITGSLSFESIYGIQLYTFGLSYNWEKYNICTKDTISMAFEDSVIFQLNDTLLKVIIEENEINYIPSSWDYSNKINQNNIPLCLLCEKMAFQGKIQEFHRIIFDTIYRKQMLDTFIQS